MTFEPKTPEQLRVERVRREIAEQRRRAAELREARKGVTPAPTGAKAREQIAKAARRKADGA